VTPTGATVSAALAISKLAWQRSGFQASGNLEFTGTDPAGGSCQQVQASFVLRPR
jgi:hypothetical protein